MSGRLSLKKTLMRRDGITAEEADQLIADARIEFMERLTDGDMPFDFMEEEFGLEPDYLDEFM
jgi:hypothetical protein